MTDARSAFSKQLEELYLVKCSLLPGENILITSSCDDKDEWERLIETYPESNEAAEVPATSPVLQLRVDGLDVWFEIGIPKRYGSPENGMHAPSVSVKGDQLTRIAQERWQGEVAKLGIELEDSENAIYELISTHLLPLLHAEAERVPVEPIQPAAPAPSTPEARYHALLTSHHLISPTKRRNIQSWSSELDITGFAKVGYPGVIYAEGAQDQVEEFVRRIKAMQWLALRVRFAEPMPMVCEQEIPPRRWVFFEKVGEVVEQMRRLGRGSYVVEMGIGSAGSN